jgi:predicted ATPase
VASRTRLIGRDADVIRVTHALDVAPVVTLVGPGGVGKTRLAVDVAVGAHVVELADLPVGATIESICGQVGFESPEAAAAAHRERRELLVLDSCEHVVDAAAEFVTRYLADPRAPRVLATSREPLRCDGEHVVILEPLAADAAAELFLDRAMAAGASWDRSATALGAVADLCNRLDGLPLAIELAAARSRAFAPATLLAHVDDGLDLLRGVGAAMDLSIRLLDDDERRAFAALGVFAGTFDVDLVQAQLGLRDRLAAADLLARFVDRSLVAAVHQGASTRYRLLELLRDHATAMLVDAGEWPSAKERFTDAMADEADRVVVEGVRGWTGDLLLRVDTHLRNLLAAIDWCVEHDDTPDRAYRLLLPLFVAVHRGRSSEVLVVGSRVVARWPDVAAPGRAEAIAVLATAAVVSGDVEHARVLGAAAIDDPARTAIADLVAERALGFACRGMGEHAAAGEHLLRGRAAADALGARSFARELAGFQGSVLVLQDQLDAALDLVAPVTVEAVAEGDQITEVWLRLVAAAAHARADRWDEARSQVAAARAAANAIDFPWWDASLLRMEASLAETWSAERWLAAIDFGAAQGAVGEVAITLRAAAAMAADRGQHELADALLECAPRSRDLTVLPELFPDAAAVLEARRRDVAPPDLLGAVARARELLIVGAGGRAPEGSSLHREGDGWVVTYGGTTTRLRDLKGIADLARLLSSPDVDVHCLELVGGSDLGGTGPALDERARREYETRIRSLQEDIDEARDANDLARAERAELELDALVTQLTEAFGLGGRSRTTGSAVERARSAVTYRVRAAMKRVAEVHPELGRHLDNAIRTGTWCSYRPETPVRWSVDQTVSL